MAIQDDIKVQTRDFDGERWCEAEEHVHEPGLSTLWSAHSPRGVLPSVAADISLSKEDRDALAKWQDDGSDTYSRTARAAIARVKKEIVRTLKSEPHVSWTKKIRLSRSGRTQMRQQICKSRSYAGAIIVLRKSRRPCWWCMANSGC